MAKLRAPARHGEILLSPDGNLPALIRSSESALNAAFFSGTPLAQWRQSARQEILELARSRTREYFGTENLGSVCDVASSSHWVIGGHQPELFHPGVWIKNAVIAQLAARVQGVGLNLTVDNDLCSGSAITVPKGRDLPGMTSLEWDQSQTQSPWEERPAPHPFLFASFGERCRRHLQPWGIEPLAARQNWMGDSDFPVVDRLIKLRGDFERQVGVSNLELRVSDLAETEAFRRFVAYLISHAESFATAYNTALLQYRREHHVRSQSHPVPALSIGPQGIELPLWVWRAGETRRRPVFVRPSGQLHDGMRDIGSLPSATEKGWKIRPRALSLTMFCRLFLGSVFVHGIGGALYDLMSDVVIRNLFQIDPPPIIVATATLRLFEEFAGPDPHPDIEQLHVDRRAFRWNPELLVLAQSPTSPLEEQNLLELLSRKHALTDAIRSAPRVTDREQLQTRRSTAAWRHREIQQLNDRLRQSLPLDLEESLGRRLQQVQHRLPHWEALRSREFAANLFPAKTITDLFNQVRSLITP